MAENPILPVVYITKYALTKGIYTLKNVELCLGFDHKPTMIVDRVGTYLNIHHKPDWHETREEAVRRAEEMRDKKIKSLRKQIERLESMVFDTGSGR